MPSQSLQTENIHNILDWNSQKLRREARLKKPFLGIYKGIISDQGQREKPDYL